MKLDYCGNFIKPIISNSNIKNYIKNIENVEKILLLNIVFLSMA